MAMTITYEIDFALYLNITNRCSNRCTFCVRNNPGGVVDGLDLWLQREPTVDEVLAISKNGKLPNIRNLYFAVMANR